jgi:hypothetical protein
MFTLSLGVRAPPWVYTKYTNQRIVQNGGGVRVVPGHAVRDGPVPQRVRGQRAWSLHRLLKCS